METQEYYGVINQLRETAEQAYEFGEMRRSTLIYITITLNSAERNLRHDNIGQARDYFMTAKSLFEESTGHTFSIVRDAYCG